MVSTYLFANKERRSATEVPGRQGGSLLSDQLAVFHLRDFGSAELNKKKTRNLAWVARLLFHLFNRGVRPAAKSEE